MRNLNLLFNKEYYQKLGKLDFQDDVISKNRALANARFDCEADYVQPPISDCQRFALKVMYPGLLIGTGNPHGAGDIGNSDEDVNLGFSFDYVTGQPYIPGSSVKGVLRSHFQYHTEAVSEILKGNGFADITEEIVTELEKAIFDNGDIFFDAVICKGDAEGRMLGFDYITPHSSVTKNPVPIRIIKVLPEVQLEFRFKISDKEINGIRFTEGKIKWLFRELILLFGAGAKTNVDYGVFSNERIAQPKAAKSSVNGKKKNKKKQTEKTTDVQDDMPEWKKKLLGLYS